MSEFSIEIKQRLSEILFMTYNTNEYMVSQILKLTDKLPLSVGDRLVSINNINVSELTLSAQYAFKDIHYIFHDQKLPFTATFKRINNINTHTNDNNIENEEMDITEHIHTNSASSHNHQKNIPSDTAYSPETNSDVSVFKYSVNNLIQKHIIQNVSRNSPIYFDKISETHSNNKICLLSTNGLTKGQYQWNIEILKCDVYIQEIGVIATKDIKYIKIKDRGIIATNKYLARAIYGSALCTNCIYYGSHSNNGTTRCYKDLSKKYQIGWCTGDIIKVFVDLDTWKIKFFINGVKVRKVMSLEPGNIYYPVLSFAGNCQYRLY
eukprot:437917_1